MSCLGNCLHCWCISGYSMLILSQVPCLVLYWVLWSTWLIFEQGNKYRSICSPTPFLVRLEPFIKNAFLDFQHVFLFFFIKKLKKILHSYFTSWGQFLPFPPPYFPPPPWKILLLILIFHGLSKWVYAGCCEQLSVLKTYWIPAISWCFFPFTDDDSVLNNLTFQSWKQGSY